MRSDHIKGHMKVHKNNDIKEEYQENTIVKREEASVNGNEGNTSINKEDIRKILEKCSKEYDEKIHLGATIYEILGENKIKQESIPFLYKEALNLFVKQNNP